MGNIIPISDFPLIAELLKDLPLNIVAAKWDVNYQSLNRFLRKRGTSARQIINNYRKPILQMAKESSEPPRITAKKLGITRHQFYRIRKELL